MDVARSNVDLATRELSDETERVEAGVDDTLPLVEAQASVAAAQSNLVESLYQYGLTKLAAGPRRGRAGAAIPRLPGEIAWAEERRSLTELV